jgi:hypothetical protein
MKIKIYNKSGRGRVIYGRSENHISKISTKFARWEFVK